MKRNRTRPNNDPIGVLQNLIPHDDLGERANPVETIQKQLASANNEDKMCGLQTLSMLCQNERDIQPILGSDIVRTVCPLLVDPDVNIQHSAAGAIRNLSAVSVDVCEKLVELDAFTPLLTLLNSYAKDEWKPSNTNDLDQRSDTFLQSVNIVWNLCESTSLAVETFNQSQLLRSFVRCLNFDIYGIDIAISVAQCLLVISEDNSTAWNILAEYSNDFLALLSLANSDEHKILSAITAAIASNVPVLCAANANAILSALTRILEINQREILEQLSNKLPIDENENQAPAVLDQEVEMIDEDMDADDEVAERQVRKKKSALNPVELELRKAELLLLAQRIAAESLTNMCSVDDNSDYEDMDEECMSDAESVHDYDASAVSDCLKDTDKLPIETIEVIKSLGIVEKLHQRCKPLSEQVVTHLKKHGPTLYRRYTSLRASLFLALQNLCDVLTVDDLGGPSAVYTVWLELGQQVFLGQQEPEIIEASTAMMRATLNHLRKDPQLFAQMTTNDLTLMLKGVGNCTDVQTRANWLKMLGVLGCVVPKDLVKSIIVFMVTSCMREDDCWTLSEGIDAFMDIFADNDWPELICELKLTHKCKEIDKIFKAKVRLST